MARCLVVAVSGTGCCTVNTIERQRASQSALIMTLSLVEMVKASGIHKGTDHVCLLFSTSSACTITDAVIVTIKRVRQRTLRGRPRLRLTEAPPPPPSSVPVAG
jgi:hypothetical protein